MLYCLLSASTCIVLFSLYLGLLNTHAPLLVSLPTVLVASVSEYEQQSRAGGLIALSCLQKRTVDKTQNILVQN